jgi:uncharacterized membrane protein YkoI
MKKKGMIIGAAVAAVLAVGGFGFSAQQQTKAVGSIAVKGSDEAAYPAMAKVSLDEAIQAALQAVQGKVLKAELEDEDGGLVYGVEVVKADNSIMDVKIDAGNGKLLKIEQDHKDGRDGKDDKDNESEDSENEHEGGRK